MFCYFVKNSGFLTLVGSSTSDPKASDKSQLIRCVSLIVSYITLSHIKKVPFKKNIAYKKR